MQWTARTPEVAPPSLERQTPFLQSQVAMTVMQTAARLLLRKSVSGGKMCVWGCMVIRAEII